MHQLYWRRYNYNNAPYLNLSFDQDVGNKFGMTGFYETKTYKEMTRVDATKVPLLAT